MKKILIGYISNTKGSGLDNYIFQLVDVLKREDVQIDLLSSAIDEDLKEKYKQDSNVRLLPIDRIPKPKKRYNQIQDYARENKYDIAYFNISEAFNCIGNLAVKKYVKTIITHSHSSGNDNPNKIKREISKIVHQLTIPLLNKNTDVRYACSDLAAAWLFGNHPFRLIRNTVDADRFYFDPKNRKMIREKYDVSDDCKIIGFVGNLTYQKNPNALLNLFKMTSKDDKNIELWILGDGILRKELEDRVKNEKIQNVRFLGKKKNIEAFYSALDLFILPSNFEGYPLVGVEAQVNGLPCLFSKKITKDIALSDRAQFFDPDNSIEGCKKVETLLQLGRMDPLCFNKNIVYDLKDQQKEFIDIFVNGSIV